MSHENDSVYGSGRFESKLNGSNLLGAYIEFQATRAQKLEEIVVAFGALRTTIAGLPPRKTEDPITAKERVYQRKLLAEARSLYHLLKNFNLILVPGTSYTDDWAKYLLGTQKKDISVADFSKAKALGGQISRRAYFIRLRMSFTAKTFMRWQIYPQDVQALVGK